MICIHIFYNVMILILKNKRKYNRGRPMNHNIIFFDIDGTLVDEEKKISSSVKQAIKQLQSKGVHVAIATGRPPFMFEDIRRELNIHSYISFNGQHIVYNGETIYENPIAQHNIIRLYKDSKKSNFPMVFMSDSEMR